MKKFASFVLSVLLALTLCIPAAAAEDYGVIYDETGQLGSEPLRHAGEVTLPALTERYGVDLRVDILTESDYKHTNKVNTVWIVVGVIVILGGLAVLMRKRRRNRM